MKRNLKILLTVVFVVTACFFAANSTVETQAATRNGWITRGDCPKTKMNVHPN